MKKQYKSSTYSRSTISQKKTLTKAARILSNPKASKESKSIAGTILHRRAEKIRQIQPAPKVGSFTRSAARRAAKTVSKKK